MTEEEKYLKEFDFEKEFEEFQKRYELSETMVDLEELKEKFIDCAMSTFFMDRIHNDYKEMYEKYYGEYKVATKQRDELIDFIFALKHFCDLKININNDNYAAQMSIYFARPYITLFVTKNSFIRELLVDKEQGGK